MWNAEKNVKETSYAHGLFERGVTDFFSQAIVFVALFQSVHGHGVEEFHERLGRRARPWAGARLQHVLVDLRVLSRKTEGGENSLDEFLFGFLVGRFTIQPFGDKSNLGMMRTMGTFRTTSVNDL